MRTLPTFVLIASVAALAVSGCRRDTGPSLEYVEAKGLYDRLIVNQGDDAYADPQMAEVESLLRRVEKSSPDHPAAQTLLATISAERKRVEEQAAAAKVKEAPVDLSAAFERGDGEEGEQNAETGEGDAAADAGVAEFPTTGMAEAEFVRKFSDCFDPAEEMLVTGVGVRPTFRLEETAGCSDRYKAFVGVAVVIDAGKIGGFVKAPRPAAQDAEQQSQPAPGQAAPAQPAAPQGPYPPPSAPQSDPNVTRPAPTPPQTGSTADDYDGIKY